MIDSSGGSLLIDKPLGWTSFQVVKKIRFLFKYLLNREDKIGHAGTLDPLATGLLIICYGNMTKEIVKFQQMVKKYSGIITLGATTPSYDRETEIANVYPIDHITGEMIRAEFKKMTGKQEQMPPLYSAKKIDGRRAYSIARSGKEKKLNKNAIEIYSFELTRYEAPDVHFSISCSKGTYIRTVASDLGQNLNSGAHLKSLRRTAIGAYEVDEAHNLESLEKYISQSIM